MPPIFGKQRRVAAGRVHIIDIDINIILLM
jgi:hypothetical protein